MTRAFSLTSYHGAVLWVAALASLTAGSASAASTNLPISESQIGQNSSRDIPIVVSDEGNIIFHAFFKSNAPVVNINKTFKAQIVNPQGVVVKTSEIVVGNVWTPTIVSVGPNDIGSVGTCPAQTWKVRFVNKDDVNPGTAYTKGTVSYPVAIASGLTFNPATPLVLAPGITQEKQISNVPPKAGRIRIVAQWVTNIVGGGPANPKPLKLTLFRPDQTSPVADMQGNSTMVLTHKLSSDLTWSGFWRLQVHNPNNLQLENITFTMTFTPCDE